MNAVCLLYLGSNIILTLSHTHTLTPSHPHYTPPHPHRCSPLGPLLGSSPRDHAGADREHHEGSSWHATCPSIPLWGASLLSTVDQTGGGGRQKERCGDCVCVCVCVCCPNPFSLLHTVRMSFLSHSVCFSTFTCSVSSLFSLLSTLSPPSSLLSFFSLLLALPLSSSLISHSYPPSLLLCFLPSHFPTSQIQYQVTSM